jgi:hypothetical protein
MIDDIVTTSQLAVDARALELQHECEEQMRIYAHAATLLQQESDEQEPLLPADAAPEVESMCLPVDQVYDCLETKRELEDNPILATDESPVVQTKRRFDFGAVVLAYRNKLARERIEELSSPSQETTTNIETKQEEPCSPTKTSDDCSASSESSAVTFV